MRARYLILVYSLLALITLLTSGAQAASTSDAGDKPVVQFVICKNHAQVRSIRILGDQASGYIVNYTKAAKEEQVGKSRTLQSSKDIVKKVRDNIEKSGWTCKEGSSGAVTSSSEVMSEKTPQK